MKDPAKLHLLGPSLLTLAASMAGPSAMAAPEFVEMGYTVDFLQSAARSRFAKIDIDSDGLQDLVFAGTSGSPLLLALGKRADESLGFKMAKIVADDGDLARVLAWRPAGLGHILTVAANGMVRDYSGWPLIEQRSFAIVANVTSAEVGDVDNDGSDDLLVATDDGVYAYSLATGQVKWSYAISGTSDLALVQLDADPALEIILGGPVPGIVLDGATRATDWQYINGFGIRLATGPLLSGGGTQWMSAPEWGQLTMFSASPWAPLWSGFGPFEMGAIATANLDDMGLEAIVIGNARENELHVIDPDTQQERFQVSDFGHGMVAVVGVDFDGDGKDEIAFSSISLVGMDSLSTTIVSGQNGLVGWQSFPITGPFTATALGDVDGDGRMEMVTASLVDGTIAIFDAETGAEEWRSPRGFGNAADPFAILVERIELVPRDANAGMDIVLAGSMGYHGKITVMDGMTHAVRLQIGNFSSGPMISRRLKDLTVLDFDNDGALDYVAATQGANGALLQVFSGISGETLWTSAHVGHEYGEINRVLVADGQDGSTGKQMILVLPDGLHAFDSSTGLLSWAIAASNNGAFLVPNGENGVELGVFLDSGVVTFYSVATQSYIRSYSLPAPLRAVTALDGDLHTLIAASGDALTLIDGENGTIVAATDYLGHYPLKGSQISTARTTPTSWTIASGTEAALYRFRLNFDDIIFADSFDNP